jgi:alkaline phosphatase D
VVIGGDVHAFLANDLRVDFDDPNSPVVATEFIGTSISSQGPPYQLIADVLPDNPHVRFFESRKRGYVSVDVDAKQMTARLRVISDVTDPKASVSTLKTLAVENGKPGVVEA